MSTVRVYVNGRGVDAPSGGSALDAVRAADPELADRIAAGTRALTDSRGLPVPAQADLYEGAIFRVVANRGGEGTSA
jgi:hypothetical protein